MSDLDPFIQSHPSARVRKLLASAALDVPSAEGQRRTLAALAAADTRDATTNFSGIALGTTVHRLLGAVTLYKSGSSPWQLVVRGGLAGAAVGALALLCIVTLRWSGARTTDPTTHALVNAPMIASEPAASALRGVELELAAGRNESALALVRAFLASNPESTLKLQAIVLEAKCLVALGRVAEAEAVAKPVFVAGASVEASELQALFVAARRAAPTGSSRLER